MQQKSLKNVAILVFILLICLSTERKMYEFVERFLAYIRAVLLKKSYYSLLPFNS